MTDGHQKGAPVWIMILIALGLAAWTYLMWALVRSL